MYVSMIDFLLCGKQFEEIAPMYCLFLFMQIREIEDVEVVVERRNNHRLRSFFSSLDIFIQANEIETNR